MESYTLFRLLPLIGLLLLMILDTVAIDTSITILVISKLMHSLDILVPLLESKGMRLDVQAHPDDFYEISNDAYNIIHYYDSPALGYLYSIPHTFHYDGGKGDAAKMLKYASKNLKHIIVADTWDYTKLFRYNVNPLGFPERAIADGMYTKDVLEKKLLGHR